MEVIGDYMEATTVDGKIYGFPTIRDMASAYGLILRNDIIEKYGIDADAGLTVEQLDDLFARIKEGEPDKYVTQPQSQGTSILESLFKTYDGLGDTMGVLMDWGQGDLTVQNLFDTEYYEECVRKAREWNEKGYILPDASTNPDTGVAYFKTGKVASTMSLIHPGVPTDSTNMTGIPCSTAIVNPAFGNTQTVGAVIQSIPVSCKNPEKVLEFVNLLYSDAEVYNALVWGIEGTHYQHVKGSEKWITYPDGVTGETSGYTLSATYAFGNRYLSYIWNTDPEDLNEKYEEFNDNAIKSKALGFVFDTTPVKAEAADQWAQEFAFQKQQAAQEQANWEAEMALARQKAASSGGSGGRRRSSSSKKKSSSSSTQNTMGWQEAHDVYISALNTQGQAVADEIMNSLEKDGLVDMYKDERQKDALGPEVRAKLDKVLATGLTRNSNTVHTKESAAKEKLADEWKKKWEKVK